MCATCCGRVQLYSRISHQKYLMYAECSKRVAEKRMQDPRKDTTLILNELLADEVWLSQVSIICWRVVLFNGHSCMSYSSVTINRVFEIQLVANKFCSQKIVGGPFQNYVGVS